MPAATNITHFPSGAAFRKWLEAWHDKATELWIGFHKKDSGKKGMTYAEALDEALCFGWIDGIRKSVGDASFTIRFTPRKKGSIWSRVNIAHMERLKKESCLREPGIKAYAARKAEKSGIYSFENAIRTLDPASEKKFKADKKAWAWFQSCPPGYRRTAIWWVITAKKEETRVRRLAQLIADSSKGQLLAQYTWSKKKD